MLREEDIRIDIGRAAHGGNFLRMLHAPTGISRFHPGPLADLSLCELQQTWLKEIEAELLAKGLTEYIVPEDLTKSRRRQ